MQAVQALPHLPSLMPPYSSRPSQTTTLGRTGTLTAMPTPPSQAPRKRKRATNYTVAYSEIKEYDATGLARDVIVIEDSPPPATASPATTRNSKAYSTSYQPTSLSGPVRTRARAALEAMTMSASSSTSTSTAHAPPQKKRKRDVGDDVSSSAKKPATFNPYPPPPPKPSNWPSAANTLVEATRAEEPCDDKEGHYIIRTDDIIHDRYRTVRLLGQGTFGKVVEAVDEMSRKRVAVKIIRAIPKYRDASKIEVRVLQKLKERDPMNRHKCIHLLEMFDHKNHICLVSELYGMCVYDFLKENEFAPFPRHHIQQFARQLLGSVAFVHELHLIHTDLKPENILLVHNDYHTVPVHIPGKRNAPPRNKRILESTDIRLIDFGSATFENEYHSTVVSTRHYRAPEIILGLGWSYACDAFSLGCILVEFYTGMALYQTHDNLEHLAMMEVVMGRMPERFALRGARSKPEFFKEGARLDWPKPKATRQSKKDVRSCRVLTDIIPPTDPVNRMFADLVRRLLAFDPNQRISVRDALNHPYFQLEVPEEI